MNHYETLRERKQGVNLISYKPGQVFGHLTIKKRGIGKSPGAYWACKCSCGNQVTVHGYSLRSGRTKSCGCIQKEKARDLHTTHGKRYIPEYAIWRSMIDRCGLKSNAKYHLYGGRGIKVCDEWKSFENFYKDMGSRIRGMQIERIDNNKGYFKENCVWASAKTQSNNRRTNHLITHDGETKTVSQWSDIFGLDQRLVLSRIRNGWSIERALTTKKQKYARK